MNGLLYNQEIPEPKGALEAEMVFYQQTPIRIIFNLVERMQLRSDYLFFDLGSGLGQVGILVNLLTDVATRGIEYELSYCDYANSCASHLHLSSVEFININAREADYSKERYFICTPLFRVIC